MKSKCHLPNQSGLTLIEIIAVLVILSVLGSFVVQKSVDLEETAQNKALSIGVSELNSRESLIWAKTKMQEGGWLDDESLFLNINTDLGPDYSWNPAVKKGGGTLHFRAGNAVLQRISSTNTAPGKWRIIE